MTFIFRISLSPPPFQYSINNTTFDLHLKSRTGVFFNGTFVVTGDVSTLSDATAAKARYGVAVAPVTWKPPFVDAVDIVIDKIRTRQTVEPVEGEGLKNILFAQYSLYTQTRIV